MRKLLGFFNAIEHSALRPKQSVKDFPNQQDHHWSDSTKSNYSQSMSEELLRQREELELLKMFDINKK